MLYLLIIPCHLFPITLVASHSNHWFWLQSSLQILSEWQGVNLLCDCLSYSESSWPDTCMSHSVKHSKMRILCLSRNPADGGAMSGHMHSGLPCVFSILASNQQSMLPLIIVLKVMILENIPRKLNCSLMIPALPNQGLFSVVWCYTGVRGHGPN